MKENCTEGPAEDKGHGECLQDFSRKNWKEKAARET
jgi:hypothetical protein